jgi:hypothetical protein
MTARQCFSRDLPGLLASRSLDFMVISLLVHILLARRFFNRTQRRWLAPETSFLVCVPSVSSCDLKVIQALDCLYRYHPLPFWIHASVFQAVEPTLQS